MLPWGDPKYQRMLNAQQLEQIKQLMPIISPAVAGAENNKNMGVLSVKTSNPTQTMRDSIVNNYARWVTGGNPAPWIKEKPKKFVDFMQRRWAPLGAENDPRGLNKNWAPNVRSIIQRSVSPAEYEKLKALNIVLNQQVGNGPLV